MENTSPETTAKVLSNKASNQIERTSSGVQQMVEQATDTALAASRRMGEAGAQLASTAGRWTEATRERVRRNPFTSIGIAVGVAVGMALGAEYLYHRRERHLHSH
jgi:ElaB/YqjD/DUF883 family membrane-anchored ribosome-binding protein